MQIEESSNTGKPWIALERVLGDCAAEGDCAADDRAGILFSKTEIPIIEYRMSVKDAIENSGSVLLLLLLS